MTQSRTPPRLVNPNGGLVHVFQNCHLRSAPPCPPGALPPLLPAYPKAVAAANTKELEGEYEAEKK